MLMFHLSLRGGIDPNAINAFTISSLIAKIGRKRLGSILVIVLDDTIGRFVGREVASRLVGEISKVHIITLEEKQFRSLILEDLRKICSEQGIQDVWIMARPEDTPIFTITMTAGLNINLQDIFKIEGDDLATVNYETGTATKEQLSIIYRRMPPAITGGIVVFW
jgi:hypothetical protein